MEIKKFSDLTSFIYDEYGKISENFGTQQPSTDFIIFVEKTLRNYAEVYNKPFFKEQQRQAKLMEALNTRPHSWIWKLFHSRLWAKIKIIEEQEKIEKSRQDKLSELDFERMKKELETPSTPQAPTNVLVPTWIESISPAQIETSEE